MFTFETVLGFLRDLERAFSGFAVNDIDLWRRSWLISPIVDFELRFAYSYLWFSIMRLFWMRILFSASEFCDARFCCFVCFFFFAMNPWTSNDRLFVCSGGSIMMPAAAAVVVRGSIIVRFPFIALLVPGFPPSRCRFRSLLRADWCGGSTPFVVLTVMLRSPSSWRTSLVSAWISLKIFGRPLLCELLDF